MKGKGGGGYLFDINPPGGSGCIRRWETGA